jgi:cytochrome b
MQRVKVWDLPLRLFHWALVIAIAIAFLSAEEDSALNEWHVLSGWIAGVLIVFRVVWGFVGGEHSRFSDLVHPSRIPDHVSDLLRGRAEATLGHNPLGAMSVLLLLVLIAATVWTGAFGGESVEDLHEIIGWTLLAIVALHVAAVIVMSVLQRENLARAMVTGDKPAARHLGAVDSRPPSLIGIILALLVVIGCVYAVLEYDPQAFTLRSAEAFEHRAAAAGDIASDEQHRRDKHED